MERNSSEDYALPIKPPPTRRKNNSVQIVIFIFLILIIGIGVASGYYFYTNYFSQAETKLVENPENKITAKSGVQLANYSNEKFGFAFSYPTHFFVENISENSIVLKTLSGNLAVINFRENLDKPLSALVNANMLTFSADSNLESNLVDIGGRSGLSFKIDAEIYRYFPLNKNNYVEIITFDERSEENRIIIDVISSIEFGPRRVN